MRAFISHSSKDKEFVRRVVGGMNEANYVLDELSLPFAQLNMVGIRDALLKCAIYVLFASRQSINSTFVQAEIKIAFEEFGKGKVRRILVICLDDDAFSLVPDWLKYFNIVRQHGSPSVCARYIESVLIQSAIEEQEISTAFVGRENEIKSLKGRLTDPTEPAPTALAISGHEGIGRRTFVKKVLIDIYPEIPRVSPEVVIEKGDGLDEVYRKLHAVILKASKYEVIQDLKNFADLEYREKVSVLCDLIKRSIEQREIIFFIDQGGLISDDGTYHEYILDIVNFDWSKNRPIFVFIQNRMVRLSYQVANNRIFHLNLRAFSEEETRQLLGSRLNQKNIRISKDDLEAVNALMDGHPINVKYAVTAISMRSMGKFSLNAQDMIVWKRKRGSDYIEKINIDQSIIDIISTLLYFRYCSIETILFVLDDADVNVLGGALSYLQDVNCIDVLDGYVSISSPLLIAFTRDSRFSKDDSWKRTVANKIVKYIKDYKDSETLDASMIEAGIVSSIEKFQSDGNNPLIDLILPSHLLRQAKELYDKGRHKECVSLCKSALQRESLLTDDAKLFGLRLLGLASARLRDASAVDDALERIRKFNSHGARVHYEFLKGFSSRISGQIDDAERHFLNAYGMDRRNFSTLRELAQIFINQEEFEIAEQYARAAYETAPTNAYVIDVLVAVLVGQKATEFAVSEKEIDSLLDELKRHGDGEGSSFYRVRIADQHMRNRRFDDAVREINIAIDQTPDKFLVYKKRAEINMYRNDLKGLETDIVSMEKLIADAGTGEGIGHRHDVDFFKIELARRYTKFSEATEFVDQSKSMPKRIRDRLRKDIANDILYSSQKDRRLIDWANKIRQELGHRYR